MTAPVLKKATDTATGDATKYGAPDVKKAFDIMDGTESGGERIQATAIETTGASDVQTDLDLKSPLISPAFTTPNLDTPSAGVLTSCTGLPLTTGVTGVLPSANLDADTAHLTTTQTFSGDKTFSGELITTGRLKQDQGADVASGSALTLGADGNSFDITGTTTINTITPTNWALGNIVYLRFDGITTVTHNSGGTNDILLGDAANMTTAAGDILTLQFDGTDWREVSRSVVGGAGAATGWFKVAESDSVQTTTHSVSVTIDSAAILIRVVIEAGNSDGNYFPAVKLNGNVTADVRTVQVIETTGATSSSNQTGMVLTRNNLTAAKMDMGAALEIHNSTTLSAERSWNSYCTSDGEESRSLGRNPLTAAITAIELYDVLAAGSLVDSHITVWELVE